MMDPELKQYLADMEARIDEKIARIDEKIEHVETTLLTEFHNWASPQEARTRSHTATLRAIDLEVESLTERVKKIEQQRDQS